jgi:hypothetical protein
MNNAIKYVKILESTGITREQAEAHVQVLAEFLEGDLVTKQDLLNSENSLKASISLLDTKFLRLDTKIDTAIEHLENKILQSEYRMTIKLGSIITLGLAAMTAVIKFL